MALFVGLTHTDPYGRRVGPHYIYCLEFQPLPVDNQLPSLRVERDSVVCVGSFRAYCAQFLGCFEGDARAGRQSDTFEDCAVS